MTSVQNFCGSTENILDRVNLSNISRAYLRAVCGKFKSISLII